MNLDDYDDIGIDKITPIFNDHGSHQSRIIYRRGGIWQVNQAGGGHGIKEDFLRSNQSLYIAESFEAFQHQNMSEAEVENMVGNLPKRHDCGWLSPNGKLFPCDYGGHEPLAEILFLASPEALFEDGWLRIRDNEPEKNQGVQTTAWEPYKKENHLTDAQKRAMQNMGLLPSDCFFRAPDFSYDIAFPNGQKLLRTALKTRDKFKPKPIDAETAIQTIYDTLGITEFP